MRRPYVHLDPDVYLRYYLSQAGRGVDVYRSPMVYQRGYGIGSIFRSLWRIATPLLKSGARMIGRQALKTGADLAGDALADRNMKEAFKQRMKEAGVSLVNQALQKGRGKRKRKVVKRKAKKPRTKEDIFQ